MTLEQTSEHPDVLGRRRNSDVDVWDTQYYPAHKSFAVFREGICSTFMPWSPEFRSDSEFEARIEGLSCENGSVGRVRMSPLLTVRTKENIANSSVDGFYANFVLSGEINIEQGGRSTTAKRGDLVLYDTELPVTSTGRADGQYEDLSFLIFKENYSSIANCNSLFGNTLLRGDAMISPLANCLTMISEHLLSASREELTGLFDACVALLPVAVRGSVKVQSDSADDRKINDLQREILYFVNTNLSNEGLSPQHVADHFGICPRYVHKLFAASGTTFSCYVTAKRLDRIRLDLNSPSCRDQPIFAVAYRWGFNNLSTFIRAFKRRYGHSPSHLRLHPEA